MEFLIRNGDYVPDASGALTALDGRREVLARVLFRLQAKRGGLPFLPTLGSRLYQLPREKPSARQALALAYVTQALEEERQVKVDSVELGELTDGHMELTVTLVWQGEQLETGVLI